MNGSQSGDHKRAAKRDQLASLLINKFRNKFAINITNERDLDERICKEVNTLVNSNASVTERHLSNLDKELSKVVRESRGEPEPSQSKKSARIEDDRVSNASNASRARSIAGSVASSRGKASNQMNQDVIE